MENHHALVFCRPLQESLAWPPSSPPLLEECLAGYQDLLQSMSMQGVGAFTASLLLEGDAPASLRVLGITLQACEQVLSDLPGQQQVSLIEALAMCGVEAPPSLQRAFFQASRKAGLASLGADLLAGESPSRFRSTWPRLSPKP